MIGRGGDGRRGRRGRRYGCFRPPALTAHPSGPGASTSAQARTFDGFAALEASLPRPFDVYSTFVDFDSEWPTKPGPIRPRLDIDTAAARGHHILVGLQPVRYGGPVTFADILAGRHDTHLAAWLEYLSTLPAPVTIRFAWEMNMASSPWSPWSDSGRCACTGPAQYQKVWRYLTGLAAGLGADAITWMFCPGARDTAPAGTTAIPLEAFWPGAQFVDIVGYDDYNGYGPWRSAAATLAGATGRGPCAYERVGALLPGAPVWLGEIGSAEASPANGHGGGKARWVGDLFDLVESSLPDLDCVCFFDQDARPGGGDWRIDSSPSAAAAFRAAFARTEPPSADTSPPSTPFTIRR